MLREFIESIFTRTTREARALGYLYETIALKHRYARRKNDWSGHISQCHTVTLAAVKKVGQAKTILILGSGPLLEIPMTELLQQFEKIILVDFVHPRDVRSKWGKHPQVQLVEEDLLGLAKRLLDWKSGKLPAPCALPLADFRADFILSANCLSQLALKPRVFLEKRVKPVDLDAFCEQLSAAHLKSVKDTRCPHLVICDFETRVTGEQGEVVERSAPFIDVSALKLINSWTWKLAPAGEIHKRQSVEMSAGAFTIL